MSKSNPIFNKKVVHYLGDVLPYGESVLLQPVDHPDTFNVTNTKPAITSKVLNWNKETGVIETMNTIYKPLQVQSKVS